MDLDNNESKIIWSNTDTSKQFSLSNYTFDDSGHQLAFIEQKRNQSSLDNTIWYYSSDLDKAISMVDNKSPEIDQELSISNSTLYFSKSGNFILFHLKPLRSVPNSAVAISQGRYMEV